METKKKSTRTKKTITIGKTEMVQPKKSAAEGLRDLFVEQLKDLYWAEKAMIKSLPKMAKNATNINLRAAIHFHLSVTKEQASRLEKVFASIGVKPAAKKCDAMEGLIKEAEGLLKETEPGAVRDAAIISASQKIEHYEIATYGTLAAYAKTLGEDEAVNLLHKTLEEEREADHTLTHVAYYTINFDASAGDEK